MRTIKRRRKEFKTNYLKRKKLLESNKPRLVIRKTNKYLVLQIVESNDSQDKILNSVTTKELLKYGVPKEDIGSLKSLSACYLGGYLLGKKISLKEIILDSGLHPNTKGSRIYSALKGFSDSGIKINFNEKIIPEKERIENNSKIKGELFNKIKQNLDNIK